MSIDEITKRNNPYQELSMDLENQPEGMLEGRTCRPMDNAAIRASVGGCFALLFTAAVVGVSDYGCSFVSDDTNNSSDPDDGRTVCYALVSTTGFMVVGLFASFVFGGLCVIATPTNLKKVPGIVSDFAKDIRDDIVDACCPLNTSIIDETEEDFCNIDDKIEDYV